MTDNTLYDVLQVSRNADPETITATYRSLAQRYHPDKNRDDPKAEDRLKDINHAYEVLSDAVKRARYDATLEHEKDQAQRHKDESAIPPRAPPMGRHANSAPAAPGDRNPSPGEKRDYLALSDLLPAGAAGQLCHVWALANFQGSPQDTSLVVGGASALGVAVGYFLCRSLRKALETGQQNRGAAVFWSILFSCFLSIAILVAAREVQNQSAHDLASASATSATQPVAEPLPAPRAAGPSESAENGTPARFARNWSGNPSDRFDSVSAIEGRARRYSALNDQRAWSAVLAWQAFYISDGNNKANVALYWAIGDVLDGIRNNKGICRPHPIVVDAEMANNIFPVGAIVAESVCDR